MTLEEHVNGVLNAAGYLRDHNSIWWHNSNRMAGANAILTALRAYGEACAIQLFEDIQDIHKDYLGDGRKNTAGFAEAMSDWVSDFDPKQFMGEAMLDPDPAFPRTAHATGHDMTLACQIVNSPEVLGVYNRAIEDAAKVCMDQQQVFLSPKYATGQPLSSFGERFACGTCAENIRALAMEMG